jgi:hypothetical protein
VRFITACVAILTGSLAAAELARAQDLPRGRIPVSLQGGLDAPLGTAGLTVGAETSGGWGIGAGVGFKDAMRGPLHTLVGVNLRAPIVRRGAFDLGALLWLSAGGRETVVLHPGNIWLMRWWQTAYRLDAVASARIHLGAWAVRLDAGVGYVLNAPRCEYSDGTRGVYLSERDCADPSIPTAENATSPWVRVTPFVSLAGEYDITSAFTRGSAGAAPGAQASAGPAGPAGPASPVEPVADGRESNAWLAPTALTLGRGKVRISAYEGIAPELAVGITDRLQVSGTFGFFGSSMIAYRGELKLALVRQGRLRLALLAGGIGTHGRYFSLALWGGGGAASICLDEACRSMVSVAVLAGLLLHHGEGSYSDGDASAIVSPNLVVALGPRAKLVMELHANNELEDPIVVMLLRLPFRHLGLELGVMSVDRHLLPVGTVSWTF